MAHRRPKAAFTHRIQILCNRSESGGRIGRSGITPGSEAAASGSRRRRPGRETAPPAPATEGGESLRSPHFGQGLLETAGMALLGLGQRLDPVGDLVEAFRSATHTYDL